MNNNVIDKMKEYELKGLFNEDILEDPPYKKLSPDDVDYLCEKRLSKLKTSFANKIAKKYIDKLIKKRKLIIKDVKGMEYLKELNDGFILTCNHFNPYDNFAIHSVLYDFLKNTKKTLYKVIKEGNYSFKGLYGFFFRNCNTLPLSSNILTMKKFNNSVKYILNNKDIILIYPEQSMWINYKKPRPLMIGAFKFSVKYNKPILPCFITFENVNNSDDLNATKAYTIHFLKPIFLNENNNPKVEQERIMKENFNAWKMVYEDYYKKKLVYDREF